MALCLFGFVATYAARFRRRQPTMAPTPPSSDQMARVTGRDDAVVQVSPLLELAPHWRGFISVHPQVSEDFLIVLVLVIDASHLSD
jgi:hypothetical protein